MTNDPLIIQDQLSRKNALDITQSFIVQAPAGSGKTELIIQRFLKLLCYSKHPEEILAITFTKKAANEMRLRIINALKLAAQSEPPAEPHLFQTWQLASEVLKRDQMRKWFLIENPNQLHIQTIDSLCAHLTKQLPFTSGFGASPNITQNALALYRETVLEILSHVEENFAWSKSIEKLLLHLDNDLNKLHNLMVLLIEKRDQWLPYIHLTDQPETIRASLEYYLKKIIAEHLSKLQQTFPAQLMPELLSIARFAASNIPDSRDSDLIFCKDLQTLSPDMPNAKQIWQGLATLLMTKSFSWRKKVAPEIGFSALSSFKNTDEKSCHETYRARLGELIDKLEPNDELRVAFIQLFSLPEPVYQDGQWETLQALLFVLKLAVAQLRLTFKKYHQIDFIENAQAALTALGSSEIPTDLTLALDYQIKHILVDEFQDTSTTQYLLLEKLIAGWEPDDGRTLFVVGDPMQSIYRFREAEVGLFLRMMRQGIGPIQLTPLQLTVNFRSKSTIVEWNNLIFAKLFPTDHDISKGAVSFSPSISPNKESEELDIEIKGFVNSSDHAQTYHIVSTVQKFRALYPSESIAILVRSRTHLQNILPDFKKAGIPYRAVDIEPLSSRQYILDLLSLTCALLQPMERIAWLAVLRAPWCGLTLFDLWLIAKNEGQMTIYEQLEVCVPQLSADGQKRIQRIFPILKKQIMQRERQSLSKWISETWYQLGGPACLQHETELIDVESYFKLLDELTQSPWPFDLNALREKIDYLYANKQQIDETAIQIMTIHTAKGLEFDTVIIPSLDCKMIHDKKSLLLWMQHPLQNNENAFFLAAINAVGDANDDPIYQYIAKQHKIKLDLEADRLFYVAMTRAKKRLGLYFNVNENDAGNFRIEANSFLEKLWPHLSNNLTSILQYDSAEIADQVAPQRFITRLTSDWQHPIGNNQEDIPVIHQSAPGFIFPTHQANLIGSAVHKILHQLSLHSITWWQEKNVVEQTILITNIIQQLGISSTNLDAARLVIHQAMQNILVDQRSQWILHPHLRAQSELTISACFENKIETIVIDRTFIAESGVRWIIDYKTSTFTDGNLETFLLKEQKKYQQKMSQYYLALQALEPLPTRLGLYFPVIPAWFEWDPDIIV